MRKERSIWPQGKSCGAMISVNLDGEYYGRIYYPDIDVKSGDILRLGRTGMEFGLPRLLDTLDAHQVKATWFVPGAIAREYPDQVREIAGRGHEIGCHGDEHEILARFSRDEQRRILKRAKDSLEQITGHKVSGFRMPEGEINEDTLEILKELDFSYSSSLSDDDIPYVHPATGLVELPIHWELFDLPYFTFAFDPPIPPGQARSAAMDDVLANWRYEWEGARRWGTLLNLQLDPQATGEQGRIFMLEELLAGMKKEEGLWLATGDSITAYIKSVMMD